MSLSIPALVAVILVLATAASLQGARRAALIARCRLRLTIAGLPGPASPTRRSGAAHLPKLQLIDSRAVVGPVGARRAAGSVTAMAPEVRGRSRSRWVGPVVAAVSRPPERFVAACRRVLLPWPPIVVWRGWVAAVAVGSVAGGALAGPALAIGLAVLAIVAPMAALLLGRNRRDLRVESQLPQVLEAMARSLRSGHSLRLAVCQSGGAAPDPVGVELLAVAALVDRGVPLVTALELWASHRPLPSIRLAVAALALGAESGGPQARAIDGVAATLRDRLVLRREVWAQSAQARASAAVIVAAPLVFTAFSVAADPRTADFLFRSPAGWACLVLGLGLDALAAWWMARIVDRSGALL